MTALQPSKLKIEVISEAGPISMSGEWHEHESLDHFWFQWRFLSALNFLASCGLRTDIPLKVLDLGCGRGLLRRQFETQSSWCIDGADLDLSSLQNSLSTTGRNLVYNIEDRHVELLEYYDVLLLFDVLEHIGDTHRFLISSKMHLKHGGSLLVNVPSVPSLYGSYDGAVGHLRRYSKALLEKELSSAGFHGIRSRHWGLFLLPFLVLRTMGLAMKRSETPEAIVRRGFRKQPLFVDMLLRFFMHTETGLLRNAPLGTSILCRAIKP